MQLGLFLAISSYLFDIKSLSLIGFVWLPYSLLQDWFRVPDFEFPIPISQFPDFELLIPTCPPLRLRWARTTSVADWIETVETSETNETQFL